MTAVPQRTITIPPPIQLVDSKTKEPLPERQALVTFEDFLERLFQNRIWNKSVKHICSQASIRNRFAEALANKATTFTIGGDDYDYLEHATKNPSIQQGPIDIDGYGYAPQMTYQLLPMIDTILKAEEIR